METDFEKLFFEFVISKGFTIEKIPENDEPSPDFIIKTNTQDFITEVTHLNAESKKSIHGCYSETIGKSLRKKINNKYRQVKQGNEIYQIPSALIIYDISFIPKTQHHDVMAIFGDRKISISVESGKVVGDFHAGNTIISPESNTALSALIIARWTSESNIHKIVYHNPFAKRPFPKNFFKNNFRIEESYFEIVYEDEA